MGGTIGSQVVLHQTVDQELGERIEELSVVGNSCHEHGLECRHGARPQLDFALLDHDDHHGQSF